MFTMTFGESIKIFLLDPSGCSYQCPLPEASMRSIHSELSRESIQKFIRKIASLALGTAREIPYHD